MCAYIVNKLVYYLLEEINKHFININLKNTKTYVLVYELGIGKHDFRILGKFY